MNKQEKIMKVILPLLIHLGILLVIFSVIRFSPAAYAVSTGFGGEEFPLGSDVDDDFRVSTTKFVTEGDTGNVGIGTFNPSGTVEIIKSSTDKPFMVSSKATGDGDYLIVNSAGNVGIGTINPTSKLSILDAANTTAGQELRIGASAGATDYTMGRNISDGLLYFYGSQSGFNGYVFSGSNGERMRISSGGNVGIGTSTHVAGLAVMNGNVGIGTWSPSSKFELKTTNTLKSMDIYNTQTIANNIYGVYSTVNLDDTGELAYSQYGGYFLATGSGQKLASYGIYAESNATSMDDTDYGVYGKATNNGVYGTGAVGVYGVGTSFGVLGVTSTSGSLAVYASQSSGGGWALYSSGLNNYFSGSVGINTTRPEGKLVIKGAGTTTGKAFEIKDSANVAQFTVLDNGNVGIGTVSPTVRLSVGVGQGPVGGIPTDLKLWIEGTNSGQDRSRIMLGPNNNIDYGPYMKYQTYTAGGEVTLTLGTRHNGTDTDKIYLSSGLVGIGTWAAGGSLEVIRLNSDYKSFLVSSHATADGDLFIVASGGGNVGIGTFEPGAKLEIIKPSGIPLFMVSSNETANGDYFTVISSGNVGIGSVAPNSTLDVRGSMGAALVAAKTGAYTATTADYFIPADASGGAFSITLPSAATSTGRIYVIKKTDSSALAVTIDPNAAETIDGAATKALSTQYQSFTIICDGTQWWII